MCKRTLAGRFCALLGADILRNGDVAVCFAPPRFANSLRVCFVHDTCSLPNKTDFSVAKTHACGWPLRHRRKFK